MEDRTRGVKGDASVGLNRQERERRGGGATSDLRRLAGSRPLHVQVEPFGITDVDLHPGRTGQVPHGFVLGNNEFILVG